MARKGRGRGKGRGRAKASSDDREERPEGPGDTQKAPSVRVNDKKSELESEQFEDADCQYQAFAGNNDLQKDYPSSSEDQTRQNRKLDEFYGFAACSGMANVETNRNRTKIKGADGSSKDAIRSTYSSSVSTAHDSESSKAKEIDIIRRPNVGTNGRRIEIESNYFLLRGSGNNVYHYDVGIKDKYTPASNKVRTIKEEKASGATQLEIQQKRNIGKQKCREVINQFITDKSFSEYHPFYDGYRNLYTFQALPIGEKYSIEVCLSDGARTKTYIVTVQPANKNGNMNVINLKSLNEVCLGNRDKVPLEAVMSFDMILRHRDPQCHQIGIGRSFFSITEIGKNPLDGQLEVLKGYNSSLQLTKNGPAVLVNIANKAFHRSGFVIEHACDILGFDITGRALRPEDTQKLQRCLRGVKVEVTHQRYPRKYIVESVTKQSAHCLNVNVEGRSITVSQFFKQKYKTLRFPNLPCLSMRKTGKSTCYIPMEVCVLLPGQPKLGKLNPKQTGDMIRMTAIEPGERFDNIKDFVKQISQISGPYMKHAGYDMELTSMNLTARVIPPPALAYGNNPSVKPDCRGVWRIDGKNFSAALKSAKWILISFAHPDSCPNEMLEQLSRALVGASKNVGLHLCQPAAIRLLDRTTSTYDALHDAMNYNIEFVFVVLSRRDLYHSYEELKFIADVKLGLITQCMEDVVVKKCCERAGASQILNNVLTKLNAKLGGINHRFSQQVSAFMEKAIVMGADAAHSPRGSKCPSIAAVVGSMDNVPFQYAVSCKVQENPDESKLSQEIILDMKEMTKHILNSYRNRNGYFPERIIFFRDGVSQGQFATVLQEELTSIQKACDELFEKIPVTFIIVQKRHQTRFRPSKLEDAVGKAGNVPPGTTVDTDVTHPVYFDYFLCSHEGIKGTSKPAHYVILHDDNSFCADDLQQLCYDLCHVYARCNRSISIPAPAMNAHLAAARAKKYIDWHLSSDGSSSSGHSGDEAALPQEVIDFVNNISEIKAPMFFV